MATLGGALSNLVKGKVSAHGMGLELNDLLGPVPKLFHDLPKANPADCK